MVNTDYTNLPPNERPVIGEPVLIQLRQNSFLWEIMRQSNQVSYHYNGSPTCEGIVTGYKNKKLDMKRRKILVQVKTTDRSITVEAIRDDLLDMDGNPMPYYMTEEEMAREEIRREYNREQYQRLEEAISSCYYDLEDYLRDPIGKYHMEVHSSDIEKLKSGEISINGFIDEDICEGLGVGLDWVLYGEEKCKEHPCGGQMKRYLNEHPERREIVCQWMQEDGFRVKDYFEDYEKRDEIEFGEGDGEYEDEWDDFDDADDEVNWN